MCGRYTVTTDPQLLAERFAIALPEGWQRRYNVAPTQPVLGVVERDVREPRLLTWGLVPHWAKDRKIGSRLINARAETLAEKPAFRSLLRDRRCLVVADGFYEWRRDPDGVRRPVRYTLDDGAPFAFAGLWSSWRDRDGGSWLDTCTIVTTAANPLVAQAHDRMPVILPAGSEEAWLSAPFEAAEALLVPFPAERMAAAEASLLVNSPANDAPEVLAAS